ncbi:hypothetical protein SAMN05877842_10275 [Ureibacillus acetophenoni]|uniref:Uncharacterized protein n=1 Tax=Ureibacillus acetophenoni TaxID=614649 RepID=A0A285U271_9BACL|nr:hypothetical protein SAMN05877842_10275 [Ureibacillus acetophenoni]
MKRPLNNCMKFYGIGLIIIFSIQSYFFWNEERVLSYFNILCAIVILTILISLNKKDRKLSKSRGDSK